MSATHTETSQTTVECRIYGGYWHFPLVSVDYEARTATVRVDVGTTGGPVDRTFPLARNTAQRDRTDSCVFLRDPQGRPSYMGLGESHGVFVPGDGSPIWTGDYHSCVEEGLAWARAEYGPGPLSVEYLGD